MHAEESTALRTMAFRSSPQRGTLSFKHTYRPPKTRLSRGDSSGLLLRTALALKRSIHQNTRFAAGRRHTSVGRSASAADAADREALTPRPLSQRARGEHSATVHNLQSTIHNHPSTPRPSHAIVRSSVFRRIGYFGSHCLAHGRRLRSPCSLRRPRPAVRGPRGDYAEGDENRGEVGADRQCAGRTLPRFRLSRAPVAGEVRGDVSVGHVDRPAADLENLPPGGREVGAEYFVHGATGKGNDQCRFQLAAKALDPNVKIIAPWRIERFRQTFPGRTAMIEYRRRKNLPVKASVAKPYSSDENCLHISYEAGKLEDLMVNGADTVDFGMTVTPQKAPTRSRRLRSASRRACRSASAASGWGPSRSFRR